jgi:hypothetical protein
MLAGLPGRHLHGPNTACSLHGPFTCLLPLPRFAVTVPCPLASATSPYFYLSPCTCLDRLVLISSSCSPISPTRLPSCPPSNPAASVACPGVWALLSGLSALTVVIVAPSSPGLRVTRDHPTSNLSHGSRRLVQDLCLLLVRSSRSHSRVSWLTRVQLLPLHSTSCQSVGVLDLQADPDPGAPHSMPRRCHGHSAHPGRRGRRAGAHHCINPGQRAQGNHPGHH